MSSERNSLVALGACQGLVLWLLTSPWADAAGPAVRVALASFVCASALVLHFAWTGGDRTRLLWLALGVGALYAAVSFWIAWQLPRTDEPFQGDERRWATWLPCAGLSLFALGPFLQIHLRTRALRFPYAELFANAASNGLVAAVAATFVGALWVVLGLWAALFGLVKIALFQDLFTTPAFAWVVTGSAAALGISIGRENVRATELLRRVTPLTQHVLPPLVSFVAVLFLGSLAFTGLDPLWQQPYASGLVLGWMALHGLLLNAAFADGSGPPPASRALRALVSAGVLTLPAYGAIAVYGLGLRIGQRGLSPLRFWGALVAVVALCVGLGYAVSVLRRGRGWLHTLPGANRTLALAAVALALATHTPVLDPLRWSARDQLRRLVDGIVPAGEFDYGFLRYELGRAGDRALTELAGLTAHGELASVHDGVARVRAAKNYGEWQSQLVQLRAEDIYVREPDRPLPPALLEAIAREGNAYQWQGCRLNQRCSAVRIELDQEPGPEWIVLFDTGSRKHVSIFGASAGTFSQRGSLDASEEGAAALDAALRAGRFETVAPRWRDVRIDGALYRVVESR